MTTTIDNAPDTHPSAHDRVATSHRAATTYRLTLARIVRSEWIKLRTLRSTWIGLGSVLLILIGIGAVAAAVTTGSVETGGQQPGGGTDPLSVVLTGANFGVLLLGVLGCIAGAREYGSRMITATVAAVPGRWQVVLGKLTALVALILPTALVGVFGAFGVGMAILASGDAATVSLSGDGVLGSLIGMAGYLTAVALLGLVLGVLLRSIASSIGVLFATVLILPGIGGALLPDSWDPVLQYLPSNAASTFTALQSNGDITMGATAGALVLLAWVVVGVAGAMVAISRRDV